MIPLPDGALDQKEVTAIIPIKPKGNESARVVIYHKTGCVIIACKDFDNAVCIGKEIASYINDRKKTRPHGNR